MLPYAALYIFIASGTLAVWLAIVISDKGATPYQRGIVFGAIAIALAGFGTFLINLG